MGLEEFGVSKWSRVMIYTSLFDDCWELLGEERASRNIMMVRGGDIKMMWFVSGNSFLIVGVVDADDTVHLAEVLNKEKGIDKMSRVVHS